MKPPDQLAFHVTCSHGQGHTRTNKECFYLTLPLGVYRMEVEICLLQKKVCFPQANYL